MWGFSMSTPFANTRHFYEYLGRFYAMWSATELNIDLMIGRLLKITPEQTHALVAGMQFGRKAALFRSLLSESDYSNISELKRFLSRIKNESLRNVFTHSIMFTGTDSVTFIHRYSRDDYKANGYHFKADGFVAHVKEFLQLAEDFGKALNISPDELKVFAKSALSSKSTTDQTEDSEVNR
jgi:hypothetical protein